jgi:hypothetical protein
LKHKLVLFTFLISTSAFALPEKIEFIFLSREKTASLIDYIKQKEIIQTYQATAENVAGHDCVPMGDGCFHPQLGFIDDPTKGENKDSPTNVKDKKAQKKVEVKTFNSDDVNMVECKEGRYFDIFCGKSTKTVSNYKMEIWVDNSSSLRGMDYSKDLTYCKRRSFITKILGDCPKDTVLVSTFNTSRKSLGSHSNLCLNYGMNDRKRLMDWVHASSVKHLIVVTDIDELSQEMRDFIDSVGATAHGGDMGDFSATRLVGFADTVVKSCKKL